MKVLDKIREKFSPKEEELEIYWNEAEEVFRERKEGQIETAKDGAEELMERTEKLVQQLEDDMEEIKDYKDRDDLDVVEDVAESFYQSRKNLVDEFSSSENIKEHHEDLKDFLNKFNDVSRKQGAVLQRIEKDSGRLSSTLDRILDHQEEIERFLDNKHSSVKNLERVSQISGRIQDLNQEIGELKKDLSSNEIEPLKSDISNLDDELEQLRQSSEWRKKEDLEGELEDLKQEKKELENGISNEVSQLERGLKKLIYNVENEGTEFENDLGKLKNLRDEDFEEVENPSSELSEAVEVLKGEELLSDRQFEKFQKSAEALSDFDKRMLEIEDYAENIEDVQKELSDLQIGDEIDSLEQRKERLNSDLEEKKNKREDKKNQLEKLHRRADRTYEELEKALNEYLNADIDIRREKD